MTIIFNGHQLKYQIESLCKLFFPCTKFKLLYDEFIIEDNTIFTRIKRGKSYTYLSVIVRINGNIYRKQSKLDNSFATFKKECERLFAFMLYKILTQATEIEPKWGISTGVRPINVARKLIAKGYNEDMLKHHFIDDFLVDETKLQLMLDTIKNQHAILNLTTDKSYSLYISIPFCPTRCTYCSFVSHSIQGEKATALIEDYVNLLCDELRQISSLANKLELKLETIYIGGGTPTSLNEAQLKTLTDVVSECFLVNEVREYTIEAGRADTITREKLEIIKSCGANRISINPQTFNDNVLVNIGRRHTASDVVECYNMAREVGFDSINMDLIAGLPTDTFESFKRSVDFCIELSPENITVHTLSIKRSSKLYEKFNDQLFISQTASMVEYSQKVLMNNGYEPYYLYRQKNTVDNLENVGYCKKDKQSLYNIFIMEETQTILAAGAGAVTKLVKLKDYCNIEEILRIYNYKYHFEYISDYNEILNRKVAIEEFYEKYKTD